MIYNYLKCYLLLIVSRTYPHRMASNNQDIESGQQGHQTGIYNENNSYLHDLTFHLDCCNTTICKCICKIPNLVC